MASLGHSITAAINRIKQSETDYPGIAIVHNVQSRMVLYMSGKGLNTLGIGAHELHNLNLEEYHKRYFSAHDAEQSNPQIASFLENYVPGSEMTYFQQVYSIDIDGWKWYLTSIKVILLDAAHKPLLILALALPVDPVHHVTHKMNRLLDENNFLRKHNTAFSKLSEREQGILKLLALGKSSQEISESLFLAVTTVETHRRNIKRKLNASSFYDLQQYALAFDLI